MSGRLRHGDRSESGINRKIEPQLISEAEQELLLAVLSAPGVVRIVWEADPVRFVCENLGASPWSKQIDILEAVRDHSRVAVRSCNGSGKTYIAAYIVLWWLMCHTDAVVITTAPTGHQVKNILWREIRRAHNENRRLVGGKLLRTSLELGDKHYALGLSTDTPERFQGFHEGHILFVVDEARGYVRGSSRRSRVR